MTALMSTRLHQIDLDAELRRDCDGIFYLLLLDPPKITEPEASQMILQAMWRWQAGMLRAEFPDWGIWRHQVGDRIRWVVRARHEGQHPHTLVAASPAEIRQLLGAPS